MSKKILLVGCGQLGSRHLQAVASLEDVQEIYVVDSNPDSLCLGQSRLKEIADLNQSIKLNWMRELKTSLAKGDLCIIATQASGRCALIKQIAETLQYKNFLVEKILSQSIAEYTDIISFCEKNHINVWVNCKTRTYQIHQYIKARLDARDSMIFNVCGGNHGLANNGVHAADLFVYYDDCQEIKSAGNRIDRTLYPSKRSREIFDLSGTMHGYSENGSDFILSFSGHHLSSDHVSIVSPHGRFIVDHMQKFALESYPESDWKWQHISIDENWLVSHMTKKFVMDIFNKRNCDLPTLWECFPAHQFILQELLPYFNQLLDVAHDYCPVT